MFRRDLLRSLIATPLVGWLRPWVARAAFGGAANQEPNAAAIYRRAFDWVEGLRPEDAERLSRVATIALDDRSIDTLIQQAGPALEAIREAAAISQFHWGVGTLSRDNLGKGRLNVSNVNIIRVACLSAHRQAESRRGREALDDVFAGLTLAHRLGTGGVMVARLLECGGEVPAFQTLGRILPGLHRVALDELSRRLDVLPSPEPASATIGPEAQFILGSLRAELVAKGPLIEGEGWAEVGFGEEESATLKRLTGGDRARFLARLEATEPAFAELARRLDLPRPRCRKSLDEFVRAEQSVHPVAAMLVESAWGVRHMVDRMRAMRAMLRAGLALVRDGESAYHTVADPFGSGPFHLERRGKGHLIRSAMKDEGKPDVTLAVGDAA
jgi:hypothetical protein